MGAGGIVNTAGLGRATVTVNLTALPQPAGPVVVVPGDSWNFQCWHRDAVGGVATSNFTDGYAITFE